MFIEHCFSKHIEVSMEKAESSHFPSNESPIENVLEQMQEVPDGIINSDIIEVSDTEEVEEIVLISDDEDYMCKTNNVELLAVEHNNRSGKNLNTAWNFGMF